MEGRKGAMIGLAIFAAVLLLLPALVRAHGIHITCSSLVTIQANLARAAAVAPRVLHVKGTCRENVTVGENIERLTIDGSGAGLGTRATLTTRLSGADDPTLNGNIGDPGITIRGRGTRIINFEIAGFTDAPGVRVNQMGTARIGQITLVDDDSAFKKVEGNEIRNNSTGIELNNMSFAAIVANEIHDNGTGIDVRGNAQAQIGFQSGSDVGLPGDTSSARTEGFLQSLVGLDANGCPHQTGSGPCGGNDIFANTANGIRLRGMAQAFIISNLISGNTSRGVSIEEMSNAANLANNTINSNAGGGVQVIQNSHVHLGGNGNRKTRSNTPNQTTILNTGAGLTCRSGGAATGVVSKDFGNNATNSLDGTVSQKDFGTEFTITTTGGGVTFTIAGTNFPWGAQADGDTTTLTAEAKNNAGTSVAGSLKVEAKTAAGAVTTGSVKVTTEGCVDKTT